jgi:hypothetical protein
MRKPVFLTTLVVAITEGCKYSTEGPTGFTLPEGDIAMEKKRFIAFSCNACHRTNSVEH